MTQEENVREIIDNLPIEEIGDETPTDEQLADPGGFDLDEIGDDAFAERMMRRLVRAQNRIIEATLQRDVWVAPIEEWYERVTATDRRIVERLDQALRNYAIAVRAASHDQRKTIRLPSGDIATTRAAEPHVVIVDEKAVLVWATDSLDGATYEQVVHDHPSALVSELRKVVSIVRLGEDDDAHDAVLDNEGNLVPGVAIEYPETHAVVQPKT